MSITRAVPQPDDAAGPVEFLVLMRRLQEWSGLRVSEIEERVLTTGVTVPGGLAAVLGGDDLPPRQVMVAFVTACGLVPEDQERWARAYARVTSGSTPDTGPRTAPIPVDGVQPHPLGDAGDRLIVGRPESNRPGSSRPALNLAPPPGEAPAASAGPRHGRRPSRAVGRTGTPTKPEQAPEKAPGGPSRPRHRRTSRRGGGPGGPGDSKRPLSLLVAAPAFITIAVVGSTVLGAFGGEARRDRSGTPSSATGPIPPPRPGWYTVMPLTDGTPDGQCLSILPDDHLEPRLARDRCSPDDRYQRVEVAEVPGAAPVVQLRAWTTKGHLWCVTLDAEAERSALHMKRCGDDRLQRFRLTPAKHPVKAGQLFQVVPERTRANGMCVGVDLGATGGAHAVHSACGRTGVDGFLFTPAATPASAD